MEERGKRDVCEEDVRSGRVFKSPDIYGVDELRTAGSGASLYGDSVVESVRGKSMFAIGLLV